MTPNFSYCMTFTAYKTWTCRVTCIHILTEDECVAEFRLRKTDIPRLSQALRIPDVIICEGTEGLCMLLKRLCHPCRYSDMVHLFARPVPVLCMITNQVLDYIYQARNHQQLSQANRERFAKVVHRKGAPLKGPHSTKMHCERVLYRRRFL